MVRRLSTVEDLPQALLSKSVSESSLSEEGESDLEDNGKHEDTEEDTSTVDLDSSQAKVMSGQEEEEEEAAAGQDMLSKPEKEKRPLHRQVAMSVSSASTHSMESTQTKSLEAQDDIVHRRSSHYPQGVSRAISIIERVASHGHDHRLQTSKSETSLADSDAFMLISDSEVQEAQKQQAKVLEAKKKLPKNTLMPGETIEQCWWVMQGAVFSWSTPDQPGRAVADRWVRDDGSDTCANCQVKFSIYERRHHCHNCGHLFCSRCSRFESEISRRRILKPVRVCQKCCTTLRHDRC